MTRSNMKNSLTHALFAFFLLFLHTSVSGQFSVGSSEVVSVATGETLFVDGLAFTPGSTFDLSGTSIATQSSLTNTSLNTAIAKSYLFTPAAPSFTGVIQFSIQTIS